MEEEEYNDNYSDGDNNYFDSDVDFDDDDYDTDTDDDTPKAMPKKKKVSLFILYDFNSIEFCNNLIC